MSDPELRAADDAHATIDVISDVVCPWCYIGKRRLEQALVDLPPERRPQVRWHPFQLNPDMPHEGIDRQRYLEAKFGGPAGAAEVYERIREQGRTVDIAFDFDRIERQPNTIDAHRLIAWAQAQGDADVLVERLFVAYFLEGRFVGDRVELAAIAGEAGYDAFAAAAWLASDGGVDAVLRADSRARELGVSGVPFFVFNGRVGVSGAQDPAVLRDAIVQAGASVE